MSRTTTTTRLASRCLEIASLAFEEAGRPLTREDKVALSAVINHRICTRREYRKENFEGPQLSNELERAMGVTYCVLVEFNLAETVVTTDSGFRIMHERYQMWQSSLQPVS